MGRVMNKINWESVLRITAVLVVWMAICGFFLPWPEVIPVSLVGAVIIGLVTGFMGWSILLKR